MLILALTDRRGQSAFSGPSAPQSFPDCASVDTVFRSHLGKRGGFAFVRKQPITMPIVLLFDPCCPTAVLGTVRSIHVDAIKRRPRRRISHVGIKRLNVEPAFTNGYPSTAVVLKFVMFWIRAAANHAVPTFVRACPMQSMFACRFPAKTAIAPVAPSCKIGFSGIGLPNQPRLTADGAYPRYLDISHSQLLRSCDSVRGAAALIRCSPRSIFA